MMEEFSNFPSTNFDLRTSLSPDSYWLAANEKGVKRGIGLEANLTKY